MEKEGDRVAIGAQNWGNGNPAHLDLNHNMSSFASFVWVEEWREDSSDGEDSASDHTWIKHEPEQTLLEEVEEDKVAATPSPWTRLVVLGLCCVTLIIVLKKNI